MLKFASAFVLLLLVVICAAEPPSHRLRSTFTQNARLRAGRRIVAARQVVAPTPAPTGYPAAGITPEVPFDLPSSTVTPDNTYLPPDETYGPPDNTYGPPDASPDAVYGPPSPLPAVDLPPQASTDDIDEDHEIKDQAEEEVDKPEIIVSVKDDGTVIAVASSLDQPQLVDESNPLEVPAARLVYQRFPQGRRQPGPVPARLIRVRMLPLQSAKLQAQPPQQAIRYQTW